MTTCRAIATTTNQPCKNKVSKNKVKEGDYYCHLPKHRPAADNDANNSDHIVPGGGGRAAATCRGTNHKGNPCQKILKGDGRQFCHYTHDPAFIESYVDPWQLSDRTLRSKRGERLWNGRDAYDPRVALEHTRSQLDHVVEKQIFATAVGGVLREGKVDKGDLDWLLGHLRELAVDREDNLRFTLVDTNQAKGAAVSKIIDDYFSGRTLRPGGLTGYLASQAKLSREVTTKINEVMNKTLKSCERWLEDEGDTPELEATALQVHNLGVVMQLV